MVFASHLQILYAYLAEIDRKIADLRAMRDTLGELVSACSGDRRPDCPILRDLSGHQGEDPSAAS